MIVTLHSRLPGQCSSLLLVREATPKVSFKMAFWLPPCSWRGSDSQTTLVNSRHLRSDCLVPHASDFPPLTKYYFLSNYYFCFVRSERSRGFLVMNALGAFSRIAWLSHISLRDDGIGDLYFL